MLNYIYLVEEIGGEEYKRTLVIQDKDFPNRLKDSGPKVYKVEVLGTADFHTQPGYIAEVELVTRYRPIGKTVA